MVEKTRGCIKRRDKHETEGRTEELGQLHKTACDIKQGQVIANVSASLIKNKWMKKKSMNEWMSEWMSEWMNEWMNEWKNEWMNEWMNEWTNEWLKERKNERIDNWMSEWMMNEWMKELLNDCKRECKNEMTNNYARTGCLARPASGRTDMTDMTSHRCARTHIKSVPGGKKSIDESKQIKKLQVGLL